MLLTPPLGPDVMGYRSHRERTAIRSGARLRPTMTAICPGKRHSLAVGLAADSGETTLTEHSGRPGPAVVGYLVKDASPSGFEPRVSVTSCHWVPRRSFVRVCLECTCRTRRHRHTVAVRAMGRRPWVTSCKEQQLPRLRFVRQYTSTRFGPEGLGLSDSAVAGSSPATRTACVAQG